MFHAACSITPGAVSRCLSLSTILRCFCDQPQQTASLPETQRQCLQARYRINGQPIRHLANAKILPAGDGSLGDRDMETPNRGRLGVKLWWPSAESNHGHADFQSAALPTELLGQRARQYSQTICRRQKNHSASCVRATHGTCRRSAPFWRPGTAFERHATAPAPTAALLSPRDDFPRGSSDSARPHAWQTTPWSACG